MQEIETIRVRIAKKMNYYYCTLFVGVTDGPSFKNAIPIACARARSWDKARKKTFQKFDHPDSKIVLKDYFQRSINYEEIYVQSGEAAYNECSSWAILK